MMEQIFSFSVLPYTGLSDHCCLSTNIKVNIKYDSSIQPDLVGENTIHPIENNFTYDKNLNGIFEKHILHDENLKKLETTLAGNDQCSQEMIDKKIEDINKIILTAAKKTFPMRRKKKPKKGRIKQRERSGIIQIVKHTGANLD